MAYPGNQSLTHEVRERIRDTFQQTIDLAEEGRVQEAGLGCDFILKMDPLFEPARILQGRLESADGTVAASDLSLDGSGAPGAGGDPDDATAAIPVPEAQTVVEPPKVAAEAAPPPPPEQPTALPLPSLEEDVAVDGADPGSADSDSADSESNERIAGLLEEGQRAFEGGAYQAAIDSWSRIFLIDVDHEGASARIEEARKAQAEATRETDQLYHEGEMALAGGDPIKARRLFEELLDRQPDHHAAREAIARLDSGVDGAEPPPAAPALDEASAPPPVSGDEPSAPPSPPSPPGFGAPEPRAPGAAPAIPGGAGVARASRTPWLIGATVLVLLVAGGWLLMSNWGRLFPNAVEPPTPPSGQAIAEATQLYEAGEVDAAIARLQRISSADPIFARAEALLAEWRAALESPVEVEAGPPEELTAEREALVSQARRAYENGEYLRAAQLFSDADQIKLLDGATAELFADTKMQLLDVAQQIELFGQREWEQILPTLWRKHLDAPDDRDVRRLLVDSYFNLGVKALRGGQLAEAGENFEAAVDLESDPLCERLLLFSRTYEGSANDLLYRIFVRQLEYRS